MLNHQYNHTNHSYNGHNEHDKHNVTYPSKEYKRPIIVAILLSLIGELGLFIIFGMLVFPEGNLLSKFIWTGFYCSIGMGAATGALVTLVVVDRFKGSNAVIAGAITAFLAWLACDWLCLTIDQNYNFFGGRESPGLFFWNGVVMALLGSLLLSWLVFTLKGQKLLAKLGL